MSPEDLLLRGQRAEAIVKDPLFVEAVEAMHKEAYERFRRMGLTDEQRKEAYLTSQLLDQVVGRLTHVMRQGINQVKMEDAQRERDLAEGRTVGGRAAGR